MIAIGVDCTAGGGAFTYAALDHELRVVSLVSMQLEDLVNGLRGLGDAIVAVNAPARVNAGVVRRRAEAAKPEAKSLRGVDLREAEEHLHRIGLSVGATPRLEALCAGWVRLGFELYASLATLGFKAYPANDAKRQWLETHPHAGFAALLGRVPLPKPTLEGRLQRALVLFERGVRIHDPMAFLEEITRHRLLHGVLPMDNLLSQEELDALVAAYTAWLAATRPEDLSQIGNPEEGFISLPIAELDASYAT